MPAYKPNDPWWYILLRHITTILIILGGLWWLATPRVQAFINQTVNERITRIETQLDGIQKQLDEIIKEVRKL